MRISLRTGSGRGEYELAGSHDHYSTASLYEKEIILEITPDVRIHTANFVTESQGKRRIRLGDPHQDSHIWAYMMAALLLPKPKRQLSETGTGHVQVVDGHYSIAHIEFDIVSVDTNSLVIRPTFLNLSNAESDKSLDVPSRMRHVLNLWDRADQDVSGDIRTTLLKAHQATYYAGDARALYTAARIIQRTIDSDEDPLGQLMQAYGLRSEETIGLGILTGPARFFPEENPATLIESAQTFVRNFRLAADRGAGGDRFRREVKQAYNSTCLFTGYYLPLIPGAGASGVDAAHILPWATHNINAVQNGLCLNKLCHWAFDAGILRLDFDTSASVYVLSVPARYKALPHILDLTPFLQIEGPIPQTRLPLDTSKWPHPEYIRKLNEAIPSI